MTPSPNVGWQRATSLGGALAALSLAGVGCGGTAYERLPRPAADLGGHWVYLGAASDDADAIITAAIPKPRRPAPEREPISFPGDDGSGGPQGGGRDGSGQRRGQRGGDSSSGLNGLGPAVLPAWGRGSPRDYVRAFVLPTARLDFVEQPGLVTITQGERRRNFQPGDDAPFSVTDRFGSRTVRSGWDGAAFVVKSTGGTRLAILERYRQLANDRLGTDVEFSAQGVKTVKVHSVYRRATASELATLPADGPPTPGPH